MHFAFLQCSIYLQISFSVAPSGDTHFTYGAYTSGLLFCSTTRVGFFLACLDSILLLLYIISYQAFIY